MTVDDIYTHLQKTVPKVVYLSGKTSTGKSTLAQKLHDTAGYEIVELDAVVVQSVITPLALPDEGQVFVEVYKKREQLDWIERFIQAAQRRILDLIAAGHPVIIDGAVANVETIQQLLAELPEPVVVYLHPQNLTNYERNLTNRFKQASPTSNAGLPARFWQMIDLAEFDAFYTSKKMINGLTAAIHAYALSSQEESAKRLRTFTAVFPSILVAEI